MKSFSFSSYFFLIIFAAACNAMELPPTQPTTVGLREAPLGVNLTASKCECLDSCSTIITNSAACLGYAGQYLALKTVFYGCTAVEKILGDPKEFAKAREDLRNKPKVG